MLLGSAVGAARIHLVIDVLVEVVVEMMAVKVDVVQWGMLLKVSMDWGSKPKMGKLIDCCQLECIESPTVMELLRERPAPARCCRADLCSEAPGHQTCVLECVGHVVAVVASVGHVVVVFVAVVVVAAVFVVGLWCSSCRGC